MIRIQNLSVAYGNHKVLDKVSLDLVSEKNHVLLGSSGSGKSTLLRAVLGLVPRSSGSVTLNERDTLELSPSLRARQLGYVPQDAELFPHMTAAENVTLVAKTLQWSKDKIQTRLTEIQQIFPVGETLLKRYPHELSGGQRQRIALQRALFLDPEVILMDEPFGALDPIIRAEIQDEVKDLFRRLKKTVLFVTHDLSEANFLGDNIILMSEGRVVQTGLMKELITSPASAFVSTFVKAHRSFKTELE